MYSIEGEMKLRRDPQSLIGQYGLHYETVSVGWEGYRMVTTTNTRSLHGTEGVVNKVAAKWRRKGFVPEDLQVEHITSLEQAEQYPSLVTRKINIVKLRRPDLGNELRKIKIPGEEELQEVFARLWRDSRIPSPVVYLLAFGKIVDAMEYNQNLGWNNVLISEKGNRTIKGIALATPILHANLTHTNTSTTTTRYSRLVR
jgi:hypothetical protein